MGKDSRADHLPGVHREQREVLSLDGVLRPSPALKRAFDDYERLREAREWLRLVEPDNDIGLAMVGCDLTRAEDDLRRLLQRT